jgi:hypothetical protein
MVRFCSMAIAMLLIFASVQVFGQDCQGGLCRQPSTFRSQQPLRQAIQSVSRVQVRVTQVQPVRRLVPVQQGRCTNGICRR